MLQKISLQILRHEKMSHGDGSDKLSGIVFDGAWLWEEYLNKVMVEDDRMGGVLRHPKNKQKENPIYVYDGRNGGNSKRKPIYPDFLWNRDPAKYDVQKWDVVLDAKYKRAFTERGGKPRFNVAREDLYQMISYMYLTEARLGAFVCPKQPEKKRC